MLNDKSSIAILYNLNVYPGLSLRTDLNTINKIQQQQKFPKINPQAAFNRISDIESTFESTTTAISTVPKTITVPTFPKSTKTVISPKAKTGIIGSKVPVEVKTVGVTNLRPKFPNINSKPIPEILKGNETITFPTADTTRVAKSPVKKLNQSIESKINFNERTARIEQEAMDELEQKRKIHLSMDINMLVYARAGTNHKTYSKNQLADFLKELKLSPSGNKDVLLARILADRQEVGIEI